MSFEESEKNVTKQTIYVSNLSAETTGNPSLLQEAFIPFGDIDSVTIARDPLTQAPLGYAHIQFEE